MSLFSKGPKDPSIQIGLGSVLSVVVLVATVGFYKVSRYFLWEVAVAPPSPPEAFGQHISERRLLRLSPININQRQPLTDQTALILPYIVAFSRLTEWTWPALLH